MRTVRVWQGGGYELRFGISRLRCSGVFSLYRGGQLQVSGEVKLSKLLLEIVSEENIPRDNVQRQAFTPSRIRELVTVEAQTENRPVPTNWMFRAPAEVGEEGAA